MQDSSAKTTKLDAENQLGTRAANMQKRRDQILFCAATIIVNEGVDALKLSRVADMASVTVPTIHNLYGKKQDILNRLTDQVTQWMFEHIEVNANDRMLEGLEAGIERLVKRFSENELYFKAGYLVGERDGLFSRNGKPYLRASKTAIAKFTQLISNGDLRGDIKPLCMAKFVNDSFRVLRSDWIKGHLSIEQFRYQFLWSVYVSLLADATAPFREKLLQRLDVLEANAP